MAHADRATAGMGLLPRDRAGAGVRGGLPLRGSVAAASRGMGARQWT